MNPSPQSRGTPDFILLSLTIGLIGFGLVMVFSASYNTSAYFLEDPLYFTKRQALWIAIGVVGMVFFMNFDYQKLRKWVPIVFITSIALLVLVLIFGEVRNGAKSWFGIGSIGGQPSEFAKLAVILYLGALISKKGDSFRNFKQGLLPTIVIVGFIAFLIMLQPDLGTTMILVATAGIVILAGGANLKHLFVVTGTFAVVMGFFVTISLLISDSVSYRVQRFTAFLAPWDDPLDSGFHLIQSLFALGHGGLTGAGFGQSIQKHHYLPEAHNDFIFAIIGEEFGFIGASIFLLIYLIFIWRGLLIALRCNHVFGTLIGTGIIGMIALQATINIGGVIGAIPITGVTLPFISSGGSSMMVTLASVGILLNISRENNLQSKK